MIDEIKIVGTLIGPIISAIAQNRIDKLFSSSKSNSTCIEPNAARSAVELALETWLIAIIRTLHLNGFEEPELRVFINDYNEAIKKFISDDEVLYILTGPLRSLSTKTTLDTKLLLDKWKRLGLEPLPDGFDISTASRGYVSNLQRHMASDGSLRAIYEMQLAVDRLGSLEQIRGPWAALNLPHYADRIISKYSNLDFSVLNPSHLDYGRSELKLLDIFIPQNARRTSQPFQLPDHVLRQLIEADYMADESGITKADSLGSESIRSWLEEDEESVLKLLKLTLEVSNLRMVILGEPGFGKSTLARYLVLSILLGGEALPIILSPFHNHLPILIELRHYQSYRCTAPNCSFLGYLHHLGQSQGYQINHLEIQKYFESSPSLIVFDGLDEIFESDQREMVTEEIIGFSHQYQQSSMLITSRTAGYKGHALRSANFKEITLTGFDENQISEFARNWFNRAYPGDKVQAEAIASDFIEQISCGSLAELAENPMLLTVMAIVAKNQSLPNSRASLYDHFVRILCHHWDLTSKKIQAEKLPPTFMDDEDKVRMLQMLAWRMQSKGTDPKVNLISEAELSAYFKEYFSREWNIKADQANLIGKQVIKSLIERNHILCVWGTGVYGFIHRTFLEYLCAKQIQDLFERNQTWDLNELETWIYEYHLDPNYREIILLALQMLSPKFSTVLIQSIINRSADGEHRVDSLVFAFECIHNATNANNISVAFDHAVTSLVDYLSRFSTAKRSLKGDWYKLLETFSNAFEQYEKNTKTHMMAAKQIDSILQESWMWRDQSIIACKLVKILFDGLEQIFEYDPYIKSTEDIAKRVKLFRKGNHIAVFTPGFELIVLPEGATLVDFAYEMHTDLGNTCIAAKIDDKLVPLRMQPENYSIVEIITAIGAHANPAWLSFVVTSKPRVEIESYLKNLSDEDARALGENILGNWLALKSIISSEMSEKEKAELCKSVGKDNWDALLCDIGRWEVIPSKDISI